MVLFKADRLCLLCSYRTIEWNQFGKVNKHGEINAKTHQKTNNGLTCTRCKSFVCIRCIEKIVPFMSSDSHLFLSTDLLNHYKKAVSMPVNSLSTIENYIGHCCIIGTDTSSSASDSMKEDPRSSNNESVSPSCHHPTKYSVSNSVGRLSGCIFFPEFHLFIDSPFDCMDIHAVGPEYIHKANVSKRTATGVPSTERNKECSLPARWHCVIPHEEALRANELAPQRNSKIIPSTCSHTVFHKIKINVPHDSKQIKVSIVYVIVLGFSFNH